MIAIGLLLVRLLCDCFKSRQRLKAEILVLRHQLNVLQQRIPRRVHLRWADRADFASSALRRSSRRRLRCALNSAPMTNAIKPTPDPVSDPMNAAGLSAGEGLRKRLRELASLRRQFG